MQAVPGAGSEYFNYKGTQSIVLMAMVDANYRFVYVDIGCNGHVSDDGGVLRDSTLGRAMFGDDTTNVTMNVPLPVPLPGRVHPVPFFAVGDDAFPLRNNLMKPYPLRNLSSDQRIFNYRLSRARRVVENVFGIFANRFRVFRSPINLSPQKVETIVPAATVLHNYLAAISDAAGTVKCSHCNETLAVTTAHWPHEMSETKLQITASLMARLLGNGKRCLGKLVVDEWN